MRSLFVLSILVGATAFQAVAQAPKLPKLLDPDLRLEAFATAPDIEAPTTVAAAPDGSVYIGCDPRDTRLNTAEASAGSRRHSSSRRQSAPSLPTTLLTRRQPVA